MTLYTPCLRCMEGGRRSQDLVVRRLISLHQQELGLKQLKELNELRRTAITYIDQCRECVDRCERQGRCENYRETRRRIYFALKQNMKSLVLISEVIFRKQGGKQRKIITSKELEAMREQMRKAQELYEAAR